MVFSVAMTVNFVSWWKRWNFDISVCGLDNIKKQTGQIITFHINPNIYDTCNLMGVYYWSIFLGSPGTRILLGWGLNTCIHRCWQCSLHIWIHFVISWCAYHVVYLPKCAQCDIMSGHFRHSMNGGLIAENCLKVLKHHVLVSVSQNQRGSFLCGAAICTDAQ